MATSGRNKPRTSGSRQQNENANMIMKELGIAALTLLPAGAVIRGGMLVYKGLKGARAIAAARKAIAAAKQTSSKTKPDTSPKPKPESGKTTVMSKPGTAVAVRGRSAAKKTAQPKPDMKRVQGTDKTVPKKTLKSPPTKTKRQSTLSNQQASSKTKSGPTKTQKAAAGVVGLAVLERATRKGGEAKADRKPVVGVGETGPDKSKSKPPKASYQPANAGQGKKPQYRPANAGDKNRKSTTGTSPDKAKEGAAAKRTSITASKNAGFGPKGNIFPSNAADRKRLMALYGGTGSAAAKAAARGTQGNLKKGKKK